MTPISNLSVLHRRSTLVAGLLSAVAVVAVFLAGRYSAQARDGIGGASPRSFVTVSGVITGLTGAQRATFHLHRRTATEDACAPQVDVVIREGGAFSVEVPLYDEGSRCPDGLFDGSDVLVDVDLPGAARIIRNAGVNPVPYAIYSATASSATGALEARIAALEARDVACPRGYSAATDPTMPPGGQLCVRALAGGTRDEVVKVGRGNSAFWVDRYEASVTSGEDGGGTAMFTAQGVFGDLPRNGQWDRARATPPAYAFSRTGRVPASFVTWFQATEACRASGKRLPTGEEWLTAARGTVDPDINDGMANTNCNTAGGGPRDTGRGGGCYSGAGAQDMIGNLFEWTSEWYAGAGAITGVSGDAGTRVAVGVAIDGVAYPWPDPSYGGDGTFNVASVAETGGYRVGLPAAARRGGFWYGRTAAGVFSIDLGAGPTQEAAAAGFRCVIPR